MGMMTAVNQKMKLIVVSFVGGVYGSPEGLVEKQWKQMEVEVRGETEGVI